MTYEEIKEKITALIGEREKIADEWCSVHRKYDKLAEEEYPLEVYKEKYRSFTEEINRFEKMLKEAPDVPENKEKRSRSAIIRSERLKRLTEKEERKNEHHLPTTDNLPDTTEKAKGLQERLVQCCIDYILETGDRDICEVSFSADGLQESVCEGKWTLSTDSSIIVKTDAWDVNLETEVREITGMYC